MDFFIQIFVNGIVQGSTIVILATGLSMMYSIVRLINFAYGEFYMIGAYVAWMFINQFVANYWLGVLVSMIAGIVLGWVVETYAFRPVYGRPRMNMFIISLGLVMLMQEGGTFIWTGYPRALKTPYLDPRQIGPIVISDQRIIVVVAALVVLGLLMWILYYTRVGKGMRATTSNRRAANLVGINVPRTTNLAFIIGTVIACLCGSLIGPLLMLFPTMGAGMNIRSLVVIIIGGLGSLQGAVIAGYLLGLAESFFAGYLWMEWTSVVGYIGLILTLYLKPQGLLGRE
ncbi:MAG: branched-chain amino acid ABC transporter permease [Dehalococcoidales bacterium]|nr:branched-chain amino acid ABC transporter permease [Dehalococcoidales bacterium]